MDGFTTSQPPPSPPAKFSAHEFDDQSALLTGLMANPYVGIALYEAVRDQTKGPNQGKIIDFRLRQINEVASNLQGKTPEQLIGRTRSEFYPWGTGDILLQHYIQVCETGAPYRDPHFHPLFGLWIDLSVQKLGDGILLIHNNITPERQAQLERQQQADLLQTIINNSPAGLAVFEAVRDDTGQIVDFIYRLTNPANARVTGRTVAEMTGQRMLELFPGLSDTGFVADLIETIQTGKTREFIFPYTNDGIDGWFDCSFVKQNDGALFTFMDVSELKRSELAQQQQAELLDRIMNSTLTGITVNKAIRNKAGQIIDFQITLANQQAMDVFGNLSEGVYTQTFCDRNPELAGSAAFTQYVDVVNTGQTLHLELPYGDRWYYLTLNKFGDGFINSSIDITDNHRYRQQLEAANLELQRSNDSLQQFAYVASHDLQEPLRKIQAFGTMLAEQYGSALGSTGQSYVQRMQSASVRMSELIKDLLAYSRVSTVREPFRKISLSEIVQTIVDEYELTIQETGAVIEISELPELTGDRPQLHQLFGNLLTNALKFRRPDVAPHVRVSARGITRQAIPAGTLPASATLETQRSDAETFYEISVQDNGIGFDKKYLDRIFQVFQRLHTHNQYPGTGVGLAICQKVAENHQGGISASGKLGEGATFRVYLPA
ncbi:PAS domain-containing protein [Spirosoma taeanense]|uniref:histidine kinase n=1 Tax=Spirosoma taeanense TaxID=2735870 RepID=A0A6M5Y5Y3_9BACT|nr:PAS domain-containing sensor histidine kinase [Spirosoma taeanense]QJW88473.1 PAS domain-containing protein [Spirosoma taeanense]